jgi:aspartate kinase
MRRAVLKFGGSSLATIPLMKEIAFRIQERITKGEELIIVVSAISKTTNELIAMAKTITEDLMTRDADLLLATGEMVSAALFSLILKDLGIESVALAGFQAGIKTGGIPTKNKIESIDPQALVTYLKQGVTPVVCGFQGMNEHGDITTLGRGGSDTTAVAIAAILTCPCEIYTDVAGIYACDPRSVPGCKKWEAVSYTLMKEMAFLGAKVMEPRSIAIGEKYQVPITVGNIFGKESGTVIRRMSAMEMKTIIGFAASDKIMLIKIGMIPEEVPIADLFSYFTERDISVDMANREADGWLLAVNSDDFAQVHVVLDKIKEHYPLLDLECRENLAKVSVVGCTMRTEGRSLGKMMQILTFHGIPILLALTSENSLSCIIEKSHVEEALRVLTSAFPLTNSSI